MKKRILILRHAQTAGKQGSQRDYDRKLTTEGEDDVRKTGSFFIATSITPDYIVSSSAVRTRATAAILNERLHIHPSHITFLDELYEATADQWINQLRQLPADVHFALLIGHNPAMSQLASIFANRLIDLSPGRYASFGSTTNNWLDFATSTHELTIPSTPH